MNQRSLPISRILDQEKELQQYISKSFICKSCHKFPTPPIRKDRQSIDFYCMDCLSNDINFNKINDFLIYPCPVDLTYLDKLKFSCKYKENGCELNSKYSDLRVFLEHEQNCDYNRISCTNIGCNKSILEKELKNHIEICEFKLKDCDFCREKIVQETQHLCYQFLHDFYKRSNNIEKEKEELNSEIEKIKKTFESKIMDLKKTYEDKLTYFERQNELDQKFINSIVYSKILQEEKENIIHNYFQNSIEIKNSCVGNTSIISAYGLKNYAIWLAYLGQYLNAINYFNLSLNIFSINYHESENENDVAIICNILGKCYFSLLKFDLSAENFEKEISIKEKNNNVNNEDLSDSFKSLGLCYYHLKNFDRSINFFKKCLEYIIRQGENSACLASIYNNLGNVYKKQGNFSQAYYYFLKTMKIRENIFKQNNILVGQIYNNIALVCCDLLKFNESIMYFNLAFSNFKSQLGEKCIEVANVFSNMSITYLNNNELIQALEYQNKCQELKIEILGENHVEISESLFILKDIYKALGDYRKESEFVEKFVKIKKLLGESKNIDIDNLEEYDILI